MGNEAKTENLIREALRKNGYYDTKDITVEEKKSDNPKIDKLLKNASKKGNKKGYPEFIIGSKIHSEFIIVIECKADISKHISSTMKCYAEYAVDGALLYASFLAKEYDVLAIGVSGESKKNLKISHYLFLKGATKPYSIFSDKILPFEQYYDGVIHSDHKLSQDYDKLAVYTRTLNEQLHGKNIAESERALLISGILISLRNDAFKTGYMKHKSAKSLIDSLYSTICTELDASGIASDNVEKLKLAFAFIKSNTSLTDKKEGKEFTARLISDIDEEINGFVQTNKYFDALSKFYIEFMRYANADKGLGIVLTPPHITDLFVELAGVNKDSVVFDNCCGTGGFLVSAMRKMIMDAKGDKGKEKDIKEKQVVGIEYQPLIYALLISNMIIHQDGKTSMYPGDCFTESEKVKQKYSPTAGLLNPPYKTKGTPREELDFVLNNLETLEPNGKCVAIVPMSCALAQKGSVFELKQKLLKKHTLEAVMSMPNELFHDSILGVVTCALVITAHNPHPAGKKTWFGYWKDDGFVKVKKKGRVDKAGKWDSIRRFWVTSFANREVVRGISVMAKVKADDEWCAEAFMETDYGQLTQEDFVKEIKKYVAFNVSRGK